MNAKRAIMMRGKLQQLDTNAFAFASRRVLRCSRSVLIFNPRSAAPVDLVTAAVGATGKEEIKTLCASFFP